MTPIALRLPLGKSCQFIHVVRRQIVQNIPNPGKPWIVLAGDPFFSLVGLQPVRIAAEVPSYLDGILVTDRSDASFPSANSGLLDACDSHQFLDAIRIGAIGREFLD